jgi:hypothetical protein
MIRIVSGCIVVLAAVLLLTACGASTQGPTAWLDRPLDGSTYPAGPVTLQAHASDADGVSGFEFFVDDDLLLTVPADGARLAEAIAAWNPTRPGTYVIRARAADPQGNIGPEASSSVMIGEPSPASPAAAPSPTYAVPAASVTQVAPTSTPTRPPSATATAMPPTPTPTHQTSPTARRIAPTATRVPPTPTPTTPPPPSIVSLQANPPSIVAGQCTTLSWAVEGTLSGVWLDGEGVGQYDARDKCPGSTTTYTLVARSPGGDATASVSVTVTHPQPTATATAPFAADLAITDLRAEPPSHEVLGDITNHGPGTVSNVTVQLSCQWDQYDPIENMHLTGQLGPTPIFIGNLNPGKTQVFGTGIIVNPGSYQVDFSCSIQVPFNDPNLGNNSHSEQGW